MGEKKKKNVQLDTLTGEEFKQLIEQFTHDERIDTIPELIAFLSDIPEGQTLGEYIAEHGGQVDPQVVKDAVDDAIEEQQADDEDIDEIFDEDDDDEEAEEEITG